LLGAVKISELFPEAGEKASAGADETSTANFLIIIIPVPAIITLNVVISVIPVIGAMIIAGLILIVITVGRRRPHGNYHLGFRFRRNQSDKSGGD
jgi:hypothetical protein